MLSLTREKSNIIPIHVKLFLLNNEFLSCYNIHMLEYNTNILKYTFKDCLIISRINVIRHYYIIPILKHIFVYRLGKKNWKDISGNVNWTVGTSERGFKFSLYWYFQVFLKSETKANIMNRNRKSHLKHSC